MPRRFVLSVSTAVATVALAVGCGVMGPSGGNPMSFFITSVNPGKGGDLGGLAGADRFCQSLATSAGAANKTWRAYLSTAAMNGDMRLFSGRTATELRRLQRLCRSQLRISRD